MIVITGLLFFSLLFSGFPRSDFMSVLPQITYGNMALIAFFIYVDTKKKKQLQIIEINEILPQKQKVHIFHKKADIFF
jgi:hypothetical protein